MELQRFPSSQPFGIQYEFHLQVFLFSPFSISAKFLQLALFSVLEE